MGLQYELLKELLEIKAVQIRPNEADFFTWTSGIKSPIYCDNRLTMSFPNIRRKITDAFVEMVDGLDEKPEVIAGCATAGIPHAAWFADRLNLPLVYVRSKPKGHGKGNQIEGLIHKGQKVLVIEDLISTGGSSIEAAKALRESGAEVIGVFAIFTYGTKKSEENFTGENLIFQTISSFDYLLEALVEVGAVTAAEKTKLLEWRNSH